MATTATLGTIKSANPTPEQVLAQQAQQNAAKYILTGGGLMLGAGALKGIYDSFKAKKKVKDLQEEAAYSPPAVPLANKMAAEKSASLAEFLKGDYATGPMSVPWFLPGMAGALYGGYQLGKKPVEAITRSNIESDLEENLKKEKKRYLQAVQAPAETGTLAQNVVPFRKAAAPFFSYENLGPALGVGTGLLGAGALLSYLNGLHKQQQKQRDERYQASQQGLQRDLQALVPAAPGRMAQPVTFSS